jgi:hypothetical protein
MERELAYQRDGQKGESEKNNTQGYCHIEKQALDSASDMVPGTTASITTSQSAEACAAALKQNNGDKCHRDDH